MENDFDDFDSDDNDKYIQKLEKHMGNKIIEIIDMMPIKNI